MDKKTLMLTLGLSMVVLVLYQIFVVPMMVKSSGLAPDQKKEESTAQQKPLKQEAQKTGKTGHAEQNIQKAVKGKEIIIETDLVKVVVNTAGGVITKWELKDYREADKAEVGLMATYKKVMGQEKKMRQQDKELGNVQLYSAYEDMPGLTVVAPLTITPLDKDLYKLSMVAFRPNRDKPIKLSKENPSETLVLTYRGPRGILVEKSLTFYNNDYTVDIGIKTAGFEGYTFNLGTDFGLADKVSSEASDRVGIVAQTDTAYVSEKVGSIKGEMQQSGKISWFGQEDKYFTATVLYGDFGIVTSKRATAPEEIGDLLSTELTVKEKTEDRKFKLYAGPKNFDRLTALGKGLEQMVDYGWFGILAKPMFWVLQKSYDITKNYGIAIIILTIIVRVLLFYPSLKSALSMEEMKKVQPLVMELRDKYKNDKKRMQQETMNLYKEHKINPIGGCLPMLLQFPFFIALYNVLAVSIELRQAPFVSFWIKDLSTHDPYYVLPVLMGLSMILMMKMTSATMEKQQEKIMMFMNVAFIFLFAWLPAGLLLYITLSNVLSIAQQMYVHKIVSRDAAPADA